MAPNPLRHFSPATRAWFTAAFPAPTDAQAAAWAATAHGTDDVLVVAPTGSGKTLAAFLWSLDRLVVEPPDPDPLRRCRVLYVSPLKALAVDVERNLRAPLAGIGHAARRLGLPVPEVTVGIRSGDTTPEERRATARRPPDILITTPESLFLLLTSAARQALGGVQTVILDEIHAVAATKRGAHLALSLERLDELLGRRPRRIGLSATVCPIEETATFLGGTRPVSVVAPPAEKSVQLRVVVAVPDMTELGEATGELPIGGSAAGGAPRASIWPAVEERIVDLIEAHRSTIVFANSRRLAERLTARLNEIAAQRATGDGHASAADTPSGGPARVSPPPAQIMAQAGATSGAPPEIARAHHGSVSREQRTMIEEDLKAGRLSAVVATSTLELGIDMGAVDLVVQVESPPSVAAGLQRVGRAGHQVGAVSQGVIFPKYRHDLVSCAVVAERMGSGAIEEMRYPRNPLDVLAQHIVAMVAMDGWRVEELAAVIRRAAPFASLPQSALEAVLDMLAGRYPSDAFAELRPRLVWDRVAGTLQSRPGAQRLAVTSGGTIPDRGLFGVFLVGEKGSRVGELDEEMVYESRVGDVFTLGSTSWRIEDITHDRVLVSPAPGQPGKLPFWKGDAPGRPVELGRALGRFLREFGRLGPEAARRRATLAGLDEWATDNLIAYLSEQRASTGHLPDDRTIVVERFRDEIGDWRLALHSPFGAPVHAPWALALTARLRERYGVDVQAMHSDDGIVLRLPETEEPPSADVALFGPDEVAELVQAEIGGSALFASRFRECAARALLLPRRNPGKRTPLWQQRRRSAQLLQVASEYATFPIVLEAVRECLQDVFDVPGLTAIMRDVESRRIRVVEVETPAPSPFARALLFGYVAAFMYEGDSPLAERRAQALSLDSTVLAELLGQAELRELLDGEAISEIENELQRLTDDRRAVDVESTADLLRLVGDLATGEALARGATLDQLVELEQTRRAVRVRIAGQERWIAVEDAGRVRDALGVPPPAGVPDAFLEPVTDPLGDLVSRFSRTHAPFTTEAVADRFGLGVSIADATLRRLAATGRVVSGEFRPGGAGPEWCDAEVLRRLRRRSLARLRHEVEPVPAVALARFLPVWQDVGATSSHGTDALLRAVEQLQGVAVPASALERLVLPARVPGYFPDLLDQLCASGEVLWSGAGVLPGNDGWISLYLTDSASLLLPLHDEDAPWTPMHEAVVSALDDGAGLFFRGLSDRVGSTDDAALAAVVWDLVWAGRLTNDTLVPLRTLLGGGRSRERASPSTRGGWARRPPMPTRTGPPIVAGRWSRLPDPEADPTRRAAALVETLLDRHGVLTRGAVASERAPGGFAAVYPVLRALEDSGRLRRGYFVEGLGAAQFAVVGAVDRLRALAAGGSTVAPTDPTARESFPPLGRDLGTRTGAGTGPRGQRRGHEDGQGAIVLAASDPANPFGAALPWPERPAPSAGLQSAARAGPASLGSGFTAPAGDELRPGSSAPPGRAGHRPGRKAGALVVLVRGSLVLYVERGGRSLLSFTADPAELQPAVDALALAARDGVLGRLAVERADGESVLTSPLGVALEGAGFRPTPRGLRLRR